MLIYSENSSAGVWMDFKSIHIGKGQYEKLKALCEKTGHKIGFHLERAINNYLSDEAPVWVQKVAEVEKARK